MRKTLSYCCYLVKVVPSTVETSNPFFDVEKLPCDDLSAVFEALQEWEDVLSSSGLTYEELQP